MDSDTSDSTETDHSRRAVLAALAGAGVTAAGTSAASAQETSSNSTSSTSSTTSTPTPTGTDSGEIVTEPDPGAVATTIEEQMTPEGPTYLAQVDSTLRVLDYDTSDLDRGDDNQQTARVTATVEADTPTAVTVTDAFGAFASRGVNQIRERSEAVSEGKTRVGMRCTVVRGMVGMGLSTDQGGVGISSGAPDSGGSDVRLALGVGVGAITAVSGTAAAAWRKLTDHKDEPETVREWEK